MTSGEEHPGTRRMMETAIRRLNALEIVILGVLMALALLAGALTAWILEIMTGAPSRLTWALSSLLFFVLPGWVVLRRERHAERVREGGAGTAGSAPADASFPTAPTEDITEKRDDGGR